MLIYHQRSPFKGMGGSEAVKIKLALSKYPELNRKELDYYRIDHIVPRSIGGEDNLVNLQLLTIREHQKKNGQDKRILNELIRKGMVSRVTKYCTELHSTKEIIAQEYLKLVSNETN